MKYKHTHIMLIEDNYLDAKILGIYLRDFPCEISWVKSLGDATEALLGQKVHLYNHEDDSCVIGEVNKFDIDIILLDLTLPDSSGFNTIREIKRSAHGEMPIVVLTGVDDEEFSLSTIRYGAQDYLPKNKLNTEMITRCIPYTIERYNHVKHMEAKAALVDNDSKVSISSSLERLDYLVNG